MNILIFTSLGLVFGGLVTFIISKYFYRKGIKSKSLSTFIQFITEILSDIDPEVEKKLKVSYNKQEVDKLYQIQYVIANTGDIPIRDIIEPLTLIIPNNGQLLDVNIVYKEPEGRNISYNIGTDEMGNDFVSFNFPLLNSGEYFITKLLIKGEPPSSDESLNDKEQKFTSLYSEYDIYEKFEFKITVDDLPPKLISKPLPFEYEYEIPATGIEWSAIIVSLIIGLISFVLSYLLISLQNLSSSLYIFHFKEFFVNFNFLKFSILSIWIFDFVLVLIVLFLMFIGLSDVKLQKKPKFKLPKKLRSQSRHLFR